MRLDIDVAGAMSAGEAALVERMREAILYMHRPFRSSEMVVAVVWPKTDRSALRIDFKAVPRDGSIGQAFLGPDMPLTEDLFDGNQLTEEFKNLMEKAFSEYDEYLESYDKDQMD